MKSAITCWLVLAGILSAGGLTFPETMKEVSPGAEEAKISADFKFTNKTDKPVVIKQANGGCSCMSVQISDGKMSYAPGESGVIRANFDMGSFWGTVDKNVSVWLAGDAEDMPSQQLVLRVHIPVLIGIEPKSVSWEIGQGAQPQTIQFEMAGDKPIHILSVKTGSEAFSYELKTVEDGKKYELVITPANTDAARMAVLRIETDCTVERHRTQQVFAVVKNPAKTAGRK